MVEQNNFLKKIWNHLKTNNIYKLLSKGNNNDDEKNPMGYLSHHHINKIKTKSSLFPI